jgi:hypothetical protein
VDGTAAVQVVLGEGQPGILRLVLEAEGFQVVGQARGEAELRRVLAVTRPSVIVLDAGISAMAAVEARAERDGISLVVVWPSDVVPALADERVDPASVIQELGGAVRRAARRATSTPTEPIIVVPDLHDVEEVAEASGPEPETLRPIRSAPIARSRRRGGVLIAATLTVALTASAAIGLVPRAMRSLHLFGDEPARTTSVSPDRNSNSSSGGDEEGAGAPDVAPARHGCGRERSDGGSEGASVDRGKPDDAGTCGNGGGRPDGAGSAEAGKNDEHTPSTPPGGGAAPGKPDPGKPDDPGATSGGDADTTGNGGGSPESPGSHGKSGRSGDEAPTGDHPGQGGGKP